MNRKRIISPSLLSADFLHLADDVAMLNRSKAEWLHLDIMDGVFVPNISFGVPVVKAVRSMTSKFLDVHLMIVDPTPYISVFKSAGADMLTVHYETCSHLHRTLTAIKEQGMKAGIALNPHTPVALLKDILREADMVLLMSVNPGFGGQKFIERTYDKVKELREMIDAQELNTLIQVDGGVNEKTGAQLISCGVDVLVAGNYVFAAENPEERIETLLSC
ncbi:MULTISPECIES: ribulose-phosphate 3-epimerase [Porphyromonas]|uniref:Ribulose-phosphate 3-epimerase n=1 Tax=Porphyromonas canoris TaxID=36875 RepID=A0ABR4XKY7_9PORP|nr:MULTISPECIES: ribulose-phosphate 3-epimerase [Porphyromonas]KGL52368.1 ribulose-phosphate 3-epimerase [Porphyromonas canoris]KGN70514.1 ribulose-phosphate 3-epimerase [Porphyromonas sp. COT-108 OH1349]KGN92032.1 ribulose-phosphate 3-epimerase [Porphyromonas canoris]